MLDDFTSRMLVVSPLNNSSFATGATMPSNNVGPWLKNCESWYVFDDSTGLYKPITKGGFNTMEVLTTTQTWIVPAEIYKIKLQAWGGGGGGTDAGGDNGPGGGGGGYGLIIRDVIPNQNIALVIGNGGAHGAPGVDGVATTAMGMTCNGGKGGSAAVGAAEPGGAGGTVTGADFGISGTAGTSRMSANNGGIGGASSHGGGGGTSSSNPINLNGILPGGGGAGGQSGAANGGNGAAGLVVIEY